MVGDTTVWAGLSQNGVIWNKLNNEALKLLVTVFMLPPPEACSYQNVVPGDKENDPLLITHVEE